MSINSVHISGNLTRDLELKYTPSGTAITALSVAVNTKYKSGGFTATDRICSSRTTA